MKKTETIAFKTTIEIRKALEKIAEEEDRSLSYIINKILEKELISSAAQPKRKPPLK